MRFITLASLTWAAVTSVCQAQLPTFQGLGDLPGAPTSSSANGVSPDGSMVVGRGNNGTSGEAFRWNSIDGMVGLGDLPGSGSNPFGRGSIATSVSIDGAVVVGSGSSAAAMPVEAFRWTPGGGMTGLGQIPGAPSLYSEAYGVSSNGSVVIGVGGSPSGSYEAWRWTQASGMVGIGDLPGGAFNSDARAVSADGSVVVGRGTNGLGAEAFRWTNSGMVGLGVLPGGSEHYSAAYGVSDDGAIAVGNSTSSAAPAGGNAFRWTQLTGMQSLGDLPGGAFNSTAWDTNGDGSRVVGYGTTAAGQEAFLWDAHRGMQRLQDVLTDDYNLGSAVQGWTLASASSISTDGKSVVGHGMSPLGVTEAFRAQLNPVTVLAATSIDGQKLLGIDSVGTVSPIATAANGLLSPLGLQRDVQGNFFVADALSSRVLKVAPSGQASVFANFNQGATNPTGMTLDNSGQLMVANYLTSQVTRFDSAGNGSVIAGSAQGIARPFDVAVDGVGNIFVACLDSHQIIKFNSQGQSSVFADGSDGLFTPISLAIDSDNNVFVADVLANKVFEFTPNGIGSVFADVDDGLRAPTGIAFDSNRKLYVANYLGNSIERFDAEGNGTTLANVFHPWDVTRVGPSIPLATVAVPEPSTLLLGSVAATCFAIAIQMKRRRSSLA